MRFQMRMRIAYKTLAFLVICVNNWMHRLNTGGGGLNPFWVCDNSEEYIRLLWILRTFKMGGEKPQRSWLRHSAFACVNPWWGHRISFFNLPNPFSCTMALGFTQPLTYMSSRNIPGRIKRGRGSKADKFDAICYSTVYETWHPRHLTTL
jgi:hypothetical protein